jgi:peptide chain release factor 1
MSYIDYFTREEIENFINSLPSVEWQPGMDIAALRDLSRGVKLRETLETAEAYLDERRAYEELLVISSEDELHGELDALRRTAKRIDGELESFLRAENSPVALFLEVRAGVGGADAALFAADVLLMYQRYCGLRGWTCEIAESSPGSQGGFRYASLQISGKGAWEFFSREQGVQRVQRVPPTESRGRVHTSTITIVALPQVDPVEINLREDDIDFAAFKGTGNGGQSVNTTDSAVRLVHRPSGIVVYCMNGKSQTQNRRQAMLALASKLAAIEAEKRSSADDALRRKSIGIGERSERRRNYDFPEGLLVDYKLGIKTHRLLNMLNGELQEIEAGYQRRRIEELLCGDAERCQTTLLE